MILSIIIKSSLESSKTLLSTGKAVMWAFGVKYIHVNATNCWSKEQTFELNTDRLDLIAIELEEIYLQSFKKQLA